MKTVSGISNWILTYKEDGDEIAVLRALTCDTAAVLPETVSGKKITRLASRALAVSDYDPSGDTIRITCGNAKNSFDNRSLRELTLPASLKACGNYTFSNCRKLETLRITDSIESIGAGSFMNCISLKRLDVKRSGSVQGPAVYEIVSELTRELEVRIIAESGTESRYIFPEYREIRVENEPTHFFSYAIEGAGYPYHSVFNRKQFSPCDYDRLWTRYISSDCEEDTAVRLAWLRVRYPDGLSDEARAGYLTYLDAHTDILFSNIIRERDIQGIRLILRDCRLTRESLGRAREKAASDNFTEATVVLLEKLHELFPSRNRNYEL